MKIILINDTKTEEQVVKIFHENSICYSVVDQAVLVKAIAPKVKEIKAQGITINLEARMVTVNDKFVHLSATEYRLLEYLVLNKNIVISEKQFLDKVWEHNVEID